MATRPPAAAKAYSRTATWLSLKPNAMRRYVLWSSPPCEIGRPARILVTVTRVVSTSGTATMASGTKRTETRLPEEEFGNETTRPASTEPRNKLPASPIKMLAGWKLYRRKPSEAPVKDHATDACPQAPCFANVSPKKNDATPPTPTATPSKPSSKLKAFVSATKKNRVTSTLAPYQFVKGKIAPRLTRITPASNCQRNFDCARNFTRSSTSPTKNINAALSATPRAGRVVAVSGRKIHPLPASNVAAAKPAAVATTMATPPR